ncbi:NusG domain II-containing protein [Candidatus Oleimmundimicrobium sp.]|uniref:NusG domain II-containing protein n=1 Tax=Candidatus Oleimmundimicrobium sp. TaxID=3060597 RepID=UPI00271B22BA|nr:NusG domain II-containing protein [Candidatus Oleimmundimicrobium sp.]MDO8886135.1 NusG domain II-containing protein [Candidatus Oleimmundimicrobium sp.]
MLTRYDKIFICILLFLALFAFVGGFSVFGSGKKGEEVVILVSGHEVERCSINLENPKKIKVKGLIGESLIEVAEGKVRMVCSPCPNHNCMARGWINRSGDVIICVPNEVIIKIIGDNAENKIDACSW